MKKLIALLATAALALTAAGCSSGPTGGSDPADSSSNRLTRAEKGAFPASVQDSFGTTTIEQEPKRVVALGWADQDTTLELGVVPVGATTISWGGNAGGSTPWFDARLKEVGGKQPTRISDADGVPFDDIAKLSPDLILATSWGLTKADRDRLQKIAPVVAHKDQPWGTSWQDQTLMVGTALGRPQAADDLVAATEKKIETFKADHPALDGTTAAFATFDAKDTSQVGLYMPLDNRPQMLEQLGMTLAPIVERLGKGDTTFWKTVSAERSDTVRSDVLVAYAENAADEKRIKANRLFSQIPAIKSGASAFLLDKGESLSMSLPSALAMPWFLKTVAPQIATAATKAGA